MKKVALLLVLCLALVLAFSCAKKPPPGELFEEPIIIEEEPEILEEEIVVDTLPGISPPPTTVYMVQIGAFYDADNASKRKTKAISLFDKSVYVEYVAPYYKVWVGSFATKAAADSYKAQVVYYFSDAFVIETKKEY